MSEFKSCPFCGGEVEVHNPMPGYSSGYGFYCPTCDSYFQHGDSEEAAAEAWNTRHEKTAQMLIGLLDLGIVGCSECGMANNFLDNVPKYCCHCGARLIADD